MGSLPLVAVLAAVGVLVAGCGGGAHPSVASLGTTTTTASTTPASSSSTTGGSGPSTPDNAQSGGGGQFSIAGGGSHMAQLAACMRSHGVPNFPEPNAQGVISSGSIDPNSPQFQQAMQACRKDLPNGGTPSPAQQAEMRQQALAFSACMRKHGLPNFPDPQFLSGGRVAMRVGTDSGIDPRSPQFQAAQKACQSLLPGKAGAAPPGATKTGGGLAIASGGGK
jgi:hypothetical protein